MRILLVEDEEQIQHIIKMNLELEGYEVVATDNGRKALDIIDNQYFDLLILDVMLPEVDGFQICQQVRLRNAKVGIIIVSAKDTSDDRITGLKMGADDYMTKPFNLQELLLRVQNLLKRSTEEAAKEVETYTFGNNSINFVTYEARGQHGPIQLTNKEVLLLKLLIDRQNEVVSRNHILQTVWGYDVYPSTRTIDNFILSFRKYFEADPRKPVHFHSVRSVGYKFIP
ncbi:MAG: response regulator transcription factor [Saprospiraceae bacterium]|nr:response regulator transcription factor [Saprospiraceae bacterium]MCZ2338683.1 response regulator transcription factor [Chitinophagales bacterium]